MTATTGKPFKSLKTIDALEFVGFCTKYGTLEGDQWSYSPSVLSPDEAVDATGRLCNIFFLQAILQQANPGWGCELMTADITELIDDIERMHGPLDQNAIARAANAV